MDQNQTSRNMFNKIPLLSELSDFDKELLKDLLIEKKVRKGTILFVEQDPAEAVYYLLQGKVRISKSTPEGKEVIISIRKPGDLFAPVSLFRNINYPATAEVIEDGRIAVIRNKELEEMIIRYPELGISIIKILGQRLFESQAKLRDVTLYGKLGALAATLIRLAKEHGKPTEQGISIDLTLTHQELANFIGAAREHVNRLMSTLEKSDILSINRGDICIKDMKKLKNYIH